MMQKALLIFGSRSDAPLYDPLCSELKEMGLDVRLEIASAHRTPEKLDSLLQFDAQSDSSFDFIIAGAGLAAHLPGVCASKTLRPVIGLPIAVHVGGVDALWSILQMPPGIPVLTAPPNAIKEITLFIKQLRLHRPKHLRICHSEDQVSASTLNIILIKKPTDLKLLSLRESVVAIYIPMIEKEQLIHAHTAHQIEEWILSGSAGGQGLWVGINNIKNGIAWALRFLNHNDQNNRNGKYTHFLISLQKGLKKRK